MAIRVHERVGDDGQGEVGRVAMGIDPSRAALEIASLSPGGDERRERRVVGRQDQTLSTSASAILTMLPSEWGFAAPHRLIEDPRP
jgi:hypothetical protein